MVRFVQREDKVIPWYQDWEKRIHYSQYGIVILFQAKVISRQAKSRWKGPYKVIIVFPYGAFVLDNKVGLNFKVNEQRVNYFGEIEEVNIICEVDLDYAWEVNHTRVMSWC